MGFTYLSDLFTQNTLCAQLVICKPLAYPDCCKLRPVDLKNGVKNQMATAPSVRVPTPFSKQPARSEFLVLLTGTGQDIGKKDGGYWLISSASSQNLQVLHQRWAERFTFNYKGSLITRPAHCRKSSSRLVHPAVRHLVQFGKSPLHRHAAKKALALRMSKQVQSHRVLR